MKIINPWENNLWVVIRQPEKGKTFLVENDNNNIIINNKPSPLPKKKKKKWSLQPEYNKQWILPY